MGEDVVLDGGRIAAGHEDGVAGAGRLVRRKSGTGDRAIDPELDIDCAAVEQRLVPSEDGVLDGGRASHVQPASVSVACIPDNPRRVDTHRFRSGRNIYPAPGLRLVRQDVRTFDGHDRSSVHGHSATLAGRVGINETALDNDLRLVDVHAGAVHDCRVARNRAVGDDDRVVGRAALLHVDARATIGGRRPPVGDAAGYDEPVPAQSGFEVSSAVGDAAGYGEPVHALGCDVNRVVIGKPQTHGVIRWRGVLRGHARVDNRLVAERVGVGEEIMRLRRVEPAAQLHTPLHTEGLFVRPLRHPNLRLRRSARKRVDRLLDSVIRGDP